MAFTFENFKAWHKSRELVKDIYLTISDFPRTETYALSDQLRRAAVSVASNLAEGCGRPSIKEKIHFIEMAYGSLMEVLCQLILAHDLNFITDNTLCGLRAKIEEISKMLSGYRNTLKEKLENGESKVFEPLCDYGF